MTRETDRQTDTDRQKDVPGRRQTETGGQSDGQRQTQRRTDISLMAEREKEIREGGGGRRQTDRLVETYRKYDFSTAHFGFWDATGISNKSPPQLPCKPSHCVDVTLAFSS